MFLFDEKYIGFEAFSLQHFIVLLFFALLFVGILVFRNKVGPRMDVFIRRFVVILMLTMEWTHYVWHMITLGFDMDLLPLGVCAISMYVTAYALWTKNEKVFQVIFPWAITGALLSLITADLNYSFPHFRFIHYFGNHGLFLLSNLYMLIVLKFRFGYKHLLRSSLYLFIYTLIMYSINFKLNTNYLFLRTLPSEVAPLYSIFGSYWVIGFILSIFILFQIIYIPVYFYNRKRLKSKTVRPSLL